MIRAFQLVRLLLTAIAASVLPVAAFAQEACPPFEVVGSGPDLVLVPGLGSPPAVWDGVKDSLAKNYRLHLVHVPGFAGRPPEGDPATLFARIEAEIIRHLDCQKVERTLYAGHSMGGFLGLVLAADHPERISGLVVVDSLPFYPLIFDPSLTPERTAAQADATRKALLGMDEANFAASQRAGVQILVRDPAFRERVVQWTRDSDRASFAAAVYTVMTTDMRPRLGRITAPVTVLAAANAYVPRERIEKLYNDAYAGLAGVKLVVIEDSYHFIMFDQPEAFEAGLRAGLEE